MKPITSFFLLLMAILFLPACKKHNEDKVKIEGFLLTDGLGNTFSVIGNADDDWKIQNWSTLSPMEQGFLNFSDNVSLTNTATTILYNPLAFPNPVDNVSSIQFRSDDSVKVKIAVVDKGGNVLKTFAEKMKGAKTIVVDLSDQAQFPSGKSLRYYYSFSATGQPNFKAGYGDIKVCRNASFLEDCF